MTQESVLIAGAGIGGLAVALTLQTRGIRAMVIERAQQLKPLGVGINLLPRAVGELHQLGFGDEMRRTAVAPAAICYYVLTTVRRRSWAHVLADELAKGLPKGLDTGLRSYEDNRRAATEDVVAANREMYNAGNTLRADELADRRRHAHSSNRWQRAGRAARQTGRRLGVCTGGGARRLLTGTG